MKSYILPHTLYHKTQWLIRDSERLREEYTVAGDISAVNYDGMPHGSEPGNPTLRAAIKRVEIASDLKAVQTALDKLPAEYRAGVYESITQHKPYPDYAHLNTWKKWRQRFIYWVAYEKGWI